MSEYEKDIPITYSINIKTFSTSKRPLTCYITTNGSQIPKQRTINQLNYTKTSTCLEKTHDFRIKSIENARQSSIHLPVT